MGWQTVSETEEIEIKSPPAVGNLLNTQAHKMKPEDFVEFVHVIGFIYSVGAQSQKTSGFLALKMGKMPAVEYQLAHTRMLKYAHSRALELADQYNFGDEARKAIIKAPDFDEIVEGLEEVKRDIEDGKAPHITAVAIGSGSTVEEASRSLDQSQAAQGATRH